VPARPASASSRSATCRQLVVDANQSGDSRPQSLLRSLSAHSGQSDSLSTHRHRQPSATADTDLQQSPAARQMSCPEPSAPRQPQEHPQRANFTKDEVVMGRWLNCVVSHVTDPENFYCQLSGSNNAEQLESLMAHIDKYVTCLPPGIGKLRTATLGQPVVAKYSEDNTWYRARVTGMSSCVVGTINL